MRYAVIDIGSNTIRLCGYEQQGTKISMILNQRVMALLGSKTCDGILTAEGIKSAIDALLALKPYIAKLKAKHVFVFATAALRNISNTEEAVSAIYQATGFLPEVLSGEEEAMFTFAGMQGTMTDGLIADIGGGSTELILVKDGSPVLVKSFAIGSLTAFVRFVKSRPAEKVQIDAVRAHIRKLLQEAFPDGGNAETLYGIGGAARTAYELEKILYPTSGGAIPALEQLLSQLVKDEKLAEESILKASPERLDTALPGVAILCEIAHFFGCGKLNVCQAGVREGYMLDRLAALQKEA